MRQLTETADCELLRGWQQTPLRGQQPRENAGCENAGCVSVDEDADQSAVKSYPLRAAGSRPRSRWQFAQAVAVNSVLQGYKSGCTT